MKTRNVYADSQSAITRLRNNGVMVDEGGKLVIIGPKRLPGIKLWGAIDYLRRFCGYTWGRLAR